MNGASQPASTSSRPQPSAKPPAAPLSRESLESFKPARVFKDAVESGSSANTKEAVDGSSQSKAALQITSVAFDDKGEYCLTAGEDDIFRVYDARNGKHSKKLYSKKYGINHARFTHSHSNVIHASTKGDHSVRYHSVHENKYLSYFQGHTGTVRSVQMNPVDDTFISAGDDGTVRLWDLRTSACKGMVNDIGGSTIAAFDTSGVVFAVACSDIQAVMLYDSTTLDAEPFASAPLVDIAPLNISVPPPKPTFTSLSFSDNGTYLLVGTSIGVHYLLDAFDLTLLRRLEGHGSLGQASGEEVCWTADSRWVLSGSPDGTIVVWDITPPNGKYDPPPRDQPVPSLKPSTVIRASDAQHVATRAVTFNPRYSLLAVGGEEFSFWLPASQSTEAEDL